MNATKKNIDPIEALKIHRGKVMKKIACKNETVEKFQEGDLVLVRWETPSTGQSRKLEPKFKGLYQIIHVLRF